MNAGIEQDGRHDFDFWFGRWNIRNERLRQRLVGSRDWEQFDAVSEAHPVVGGIGNVDSFDTNWNGGFRGMSLRLFNPAARQWSIYRASDRDGVLEPPVIGAFRNGIGEFLGRDQHHGVAVLARFIWSDITASSAKWEQAFSTDDGGTWETNWIMHMTRLAAWQ